MTLHKLRRRYPWLDGWVNNIAREASRHATGLILMRHTQLALQGSVASADLVLKAHGGFYDRGVPAGDEPSDGKVIVDHNYLIPRPDYAGAAAAEAARAALPPVTIDLPPAAAPGRKVPFIKTSFP